MMGEKALSRNEITNVRAEVWITTGVQVNEIETWTGVNRGAWMRIEKKQQIVVLKMRGKCKKFHFGFLLHMHSTHAHLHRPHLNCVVRKKRTILPFFTICIPLRSCFSQACGNCILDSLAARERAVSFKTLILWLPVRAILSFLKVL